MAEARHEAGTAKVSTVELFFDLVFVFTITQLTHLVEHAHDWLGFVQPLLVFTVIWWHYAGYVWLTNATGAPERMRLVLVAAMAGFLVMAVSVPDVFHAGGLAFGLAYLVVVLLHLGAFAWQGGRAALPGVLGLAPINLGAAAFVLAAGILDAPWDWMLFAGAAAMFLLSTLIRREAGFSVRATHFAERHGLVLLIALGESIISIGLGAAEHLADPATLAAIVAGLALIAALWWTYFDRDDERGEHALERAAPAEQSRMALVGYWYTHLLMIAGIVLLASGIKGIVEHAREVTWGPSWMLAAGAALTLLGSAAFRARMQIKAPTSRIVGAVAILAVGAAGMAVPGIAALALAAAMMVGLVLVERATGAASRPHLFAGRA